MKQLGIILAIIVGIAGGWYFYNGGLAPKQKLDPEAAATEITHRLGASIMSKGALGTLVCAQPPSDTAQVCMGHRTNAFEARKDIDAVMNRTNAKPTGDWHASAAGYTRLWEYGDSLRDRMQIMVTAELLIIHWDYDPLERFRRN